MKLNQNAAYKTAKEFTIIAMEHSMIKVATDSKETAQNVVDFFNHIVDCLSDTPLE